MKSPRKYCLVLVLSVAATFQPGYGDTFDRIKTRLRTAECVSFRFQSIVASTIFESCDTLNGTASFRLGGRYDIWLGRDRYLFTGKELYAYSSDNRQVTVEEVGPKEQFNAQVSFITRLDEIFRSQVVRPDSIYKLVKRVRGYTGVPDTLIVTIDRKGQTIRRIEYKDVNDEPTSIVFLEQSFPADCGPMELKPQFGDSVQVIRLK